MRTEEEQIENLRQALQIVRNCKSLEEAEQRLRELVQSKRENKDN